MLIDPFSQQEKSDSSETKPLKIDEKLMKKNWNSGIES